MTVEELLKERWTVEAEAITPDVDAAWRRVEVRVAAPARPWRHRGVAAVAAGAIALGAAVGLVRLGGSDEGSLADEATVLRGSRVSGALWPTFDLEDLLDLERAVDADPAARWMTDPKAVARRYLSTHLGLEVRTLERAGDHELRYETASSSGTLFMTRMPWGRVWLVRFQQDDAIALRDGGISGGSDAVTANFQISASVSGTIETSFVVHTPSSVSVTESDPRRIPAGASAIDFVGRLDHSFFVGIVRIRLIPDGGGREVVIEQTVASQGPTHSGTFHSGDPIPPAFARTASITGIPGQTPLSASESVLQPDYGCARVDRALRHCTWQGSFFGYDVNGGVAMFIAPGDGTRVQLRARSGEMREVALTRPEGFQRSYGTIELPAGFDPVEAIAFAADGREVARTEGPTPDDGW